MFNKVKEVGLSVEDCSCLAQDAYRIFGVYWSLGAEKNASLPPYWPARLSALSSSQDPLHLKFNGVPAQVYLSVSSELSTGFIRSRKSRKSRGSLEILFSNPGKVMEL